MKTRYEQALYRKRLTMFIPALQIMLAEKEF